MNKNVSLLILLTALTTAAFAQEGFKFSGYLNSGVGVLSSDAEDADTLVKAYAVDAWKNGYRIRLNGAYTNADKTAGINFRFQAQNVHANGYFTLPYFYGWVQFLGDLFTLSGGLVDDGTWATPDFWIVDDAGEGLGALLKAKPVDGLDLGLGAYVISQLGGGGNNALAIIDLANTVKIGDVKYVYSGAFTLPDVFRIGASFRWKNQAGGGNPASSYGGYQEHSALLGDLRILAVKDLTAVVAFNVETIDDFDNAGNITLSETFGYKLNDLGIGLNAVQFLYNRTDAVGEKVDYEPGLLFNLWGSYAIGKVVPRIDLVYFMGGQSNVADVKKLAYDRHGYTNKLGLKDQDDDYSVIGVRPSVKINFNSSTFVEIGDAINLDTVNFDVNSPYADSGDDKKKDRFTNAFYIDLKWSF